MHKDGVGRPAGAVSGVDVPEDMEPRPDSEDRFKKIRTAFPALFASAMVKDGEGRTVRNQDVGIFWNLCPVLFPVFGI